MDDLLKNNTELQIGGARKKRGRQGQQEKKKKDREKKEREKKDREKKEREKKDREKKEREKKDREKKGKKKGKRGEDRKTEREKKGRKFIIKMPNGDIENLNSFDEALFKAGAGQFRGAKIIKEEGKRKSKEERRGRGKEERRGKGKEERGGRGKEERGEKQTKTVKLISSKLKKCDVEKSLRTGFIKYLTSKESDNKMEKLIDKAISKRLPEDQYKSMRAEQKTYMNWLSSITGEEWQGGEDNSNVGNNWVKVNNKEKIQNNILSNTTDYNSTNSGTNNSYEKFKY